MAKGRKRNDDLEIVYEDQWLIIVNKPSGLLSMSTGKQGEDTAYARVFDYAGKDHRLHFLEAGNSLGARPAQMRDGITHLHFDSRFDS